MRFREFGWFHDVGRAYQGFICPVYLECGCSRDRRVMGLFDGYDAMRGSSAEISGLLRIPIVLVVNAKSTAYLVAPLLYGFRNFRKDLNVVGAVFNFVASESHYSFLRQACEDAGVEALGYLPKCADVEIPSRHLGLSLDEDFALRSLRTGLLAWWRSMWI